jgi:RNA polymerase sigma-70 factor (ECF subfamily)
MPPVDALEQSFLAAIEQHRGLLMRLVHLYANDREEQRDLYQEVLFQAWKSWPKFRGESTRSTWLYRVALNTILTAQRKQVTDTMPLFPDIDYANSVVSPDRAEAAQRLYRAMRDLSEADRAIMALHLDGYSHPEIAELMGIVSNHVGVKLFRIKQQLKERLNPSL